MYQYKKEKQREREKKSMIIKNEEMIMNRKIVSILQ